MNWLKNLKVSRKLGLAFAIVVALGFFVNYTTERALESGGKSLESIYQDRVAPLTQLKAVSDAYAVFIVDASHKARNGNFTHAEALSGIGKARETIKKNWTEYTSTQMTPEEDKLIAEVKPLMEKGDQSINKLESILKSGDQTALANFTISELYPSIDPITDKISQLTELQLRVAKEVYIKANAEGKKAAESAKLLSALAALISVLAAWLISNAITKPLGEMQMVATKIAEGDVNLALTYSSKDEIGTLAQAFQRMISYLKQNADLLTRVSHGDLTVQPSLASERDALGRALGGMVDGMRALVHSLNTRITENREIGQQLGEAARYTAESSTEIAKTVEQVAQATDQAAQTTAKIASGSEDLARLVTVAATAVDHLESAIAQVSEGSHRQQNAVDEATRTATEGGKAFENTVTSLARIQAQVEVSASTVRELGRKQEEIGAIVKTIDEIAEQTNLLALNAAIEAARAGEHGRGFAVVADEVRRLAERSSGATKEIADLIESVRVGVEDAVKAMDTTSDEVEKGATQSSAIQAGYSQILETITELGTIATLNTHAVRDMETGAKDVTESFSAVTEVSQNTAAAAEELSAMTQEMAASAQEVAANVHEQDRRVLEIREVSNRIETAAEELAEDVSQFQVESSSSHLQLAA
ncbi:MAG: MCP four helix bundle domain-containing protein [Armatimonadetes bacterium]|nr:MCP four helix bundle domain-containing protein [Armatimonadota bacterium]